MPGNGIVGEKHTRWCLRTAEAASTAIAFNELGPLPNRIRVTYRPEINHFQGQDALQLIVESWQPD